MRENEENGLLTKLRIEFFDRHKAYEEPFFSSSWVT